MFAPIPFSILDLVVFIIASLTNLLLAVMFLLRARGRQQAGSVVGLASLALGIPLAVVIALNWLGARPWWAVFLPGLLLIYDVVEFVLDNILRSNFRHTAWLGPYLGLFYLALMGMIGYNFAASKSYGFLTLATYFINLAATFYSYKKVGHG